RNMSINDAEAAIGNLLSGVRAEIIPIDAEIGRAAIKAFDRFGRGRHAARLNMGDCFAYACAQTLAVPLLFKGDDFSQTDVAIASRKTNAEGAGIVRVRSRNTRVIAAGTQAPR